MSLTKLSIERRLGLNSYDTDKESHIKVNKESCTERDAKILLRICPANCFTLTSNEVVFSRLGCLECGACRAAVSSGAIDWAFPKGGFGVRYRYG
jgi:ferredoxin like protein